MADVNAITVGHTVKLNIVVFNKEPVLTFDMIDVAHGKADGQARTNFTRNKQRFVEGKHYHMVGYADAAAMEAYGVNVPPRGLTLITKRGYLLLVKSFTDDLAWDVQEQLVDYYFEGQVQKSAVETITATQLKALGDQMDNVTRYMMHKKSSLAQTLWRNLKAEFGYERIEDVPAAQYQAVMDWIGKHQDIAHRLWDVTRDIETQFVTILKGKRQKPEDQCREMLAKLEAPLVQLLEAA
jgi:hypothetical protein